MKLYFTLRRVLDQEIFCLAFAIDDKKPQVIYQICQDTIQCCQACYQRLIFS